MKITNLFEIVAFILIIVFTNSCGTQKTYQKLQPTGGLGEYVIIQIPDLKTNLEFFPADITWHIPNQIAEKLTKEKLFIGVSRSPVDINKSVLILDGTLTDFSPKDWYKQLVNTGRIVVDVQFIDKSDGRVIAEAKFEGTAKWGVLGGGMAYADNRLVDEIIEYIKLSYSR